MFYNFFGLIYRQVRNKGNFDKITKVIIFENKLYVAIGLYRVFQKLVLKNRTQVNDRFPTFDVKEEYKIREITLTQLY